MIATTSQTAHDGIRNLVMQFTGLSDGTDQEANAVKVDVSELDPPCAAVKVRKVTYDVRGGSVKLTWDANTTPEDFLILSGQGAFDYCRIEGLVNKAVGATGDITLTTVGFENNSFYSIKLDMVKK